MAAGIADSHAILISLSYRVRGIVIRNRVITTRIPATAVVASFVLPVKYKVTDTNMMKITAQYSAIKIMENKDP